MASLCQDVHNEPVQIQEIATFLAKLDTTEGSQNKFAEYKALVETSQVGACLNKLATELELLFEKAEDSKLISFFALFTNLLLKHDRTGLLPKVVGQIASSHNNKEVRLQILGDIFNLDGNLAHRFQILDSIFHYAAETDQIEAIQHHVLAIDEWIFELQLDAKQTQKLLSSLLPGLHNTSESRDLLIRFLQTFKTDTELGSFTETVTKTLVKFMKGLPAEVTELDEILTDCPVLASVKGNAVLDLLDIYVNGDLNQLAAFTEKNKDFLTSNGLLESSKQVVSFGLLSRLFASSAVVTYAQVSEQLQISEDEVEFVVIDAVTSGLVDVRLNQAEKSIAVRYAKQRKYTEEDWKKLGQRVELFQKNIEALVKVLEDAQ